jgi:hypothetical protein
MATVAVPLNRNMARRLSCRHNAIMTTRTPSQNGRMVHVDNRHPGVGTMTGFTLARRVYMAG